MQKLIVFALVLCFAATATAYDITNPAPGPKPQSQAPVNVPNPDRQGGDTIVDAVMVTLPVVDGTGTTLGFNDYYDEVCPYSGSTSPDVVYTFVADADQLVNVDLCGSLYDTKVYVYDEFLNLVACNDDFYFFGDPCGQYVSKIEDMPVATGTQYFVIVDGYGGDAGVYTINIEAFDPPPPCIVDCEDGDQIEGEPMLEDGYVDTFNAGCNSAPESYSYIESPTFCGKLGWFLGPDGTGYRDLDWQKAIMPSTGSLELNFIAEFESYIYHFDGDCVDYEIVNGVVVPPCEWGQITISGDDYPPGSEVIILTGANSFYDGVTMEFNYRIVSNIEAPVATEGHTWSNVKAMFE